VDRPVAADGHEQLGAVLGSLPRELRQLSGPL
jgi:hypothetical protein